ncbi:MAG TPA: hypothetical protein VF806_01210 [Anaerolineaceae bacterium]
MFRTDARIKIEEELARGEAARRDGLEGRARVCARRAAGAAVREYLELQGLPIPGPSAVDLLTFLQNEPGTIQAVREAAGRLLARVDEGFALPVDVDLLADARWLAAELERLAGGN